MDYRNAVREFKSMYAHLFNNRVDYWTAQETWAAWVDSLNKEGRITDTQAFQWATPFRYGKHLRPLIRKEVE